MSSKRTSSKPSAGGPSAKKASSNDYERDETIFSDSTFDEVTRVYTYCGGWVDIDARIKKLIKSVVIEEGVTEIADGKYINGEVFGLFEHCTALTSITFPQTGTFVKIGSWALYICTALATLTVPDSCVDIEKYALRGCSSLTSFTFPNKCTKISEDVLYGCSSLTTLAIPNACTQIHEDAFRRCTALEVLASKSNLSIEQFCRKKWRSPRFFAFKVNLFACYNVLNRLRVNDPLLDDPLIDKTSILWVMYDKITSDDVRRKIMEYLDYKWMGNS